MGTGNELFWAWTFCTCSVHISLDADVALRFDDEDENYFALRSKQGVMISVEQARTTANQLFECCKLYDRASKKCTVSSNVVTECH